MKKSVLGKYGAKCGEDSKWSNNKVDLKSMDNNQQRVMLPSLIESQHEIKHGQHQYNNTVLLGATQTLPAPLSTNSQQDSSNHSFAQFNSNSFTQLNSNSFTQLNSNSFNSTTSLFDIDTDFDFDTDKSAFDSIDSGQTIYSNIIPNVFSQEVINQVPQTISYYPPEGVPFVNTVFTNNLNQSVVFQNNLPIGAPIGFGHPQYDSKGQQIYWRAPSTSHNQPQPFHNPFYGYTSFDPLINPTVNSPVNSLINPTVNTSVNPLINPTVNTSVNPLINSTINTPVSSSVNYTFTKPNEFTKLNEIKVKEKIESPDSPNLQTSNIYVNNFTPNKSLKFDIKSKPSKSSFEQVIIKCHDKLNIFGTLAAHRTLRNQDPNEQYEQKKKYASIDFQQFTQLKINSSKDRKEEKRLLLLKTILDLKFKKSAIDNNHVYYAYFKRSMNGFSGLMRIQPKGIKRARVCGQKWYMILFILQNDIQVSLENKTFHGMLTTGDELYLPSDILFELRNPRSTEETYIYFRVYFNNQTDQNHHSTHSIV